MESGEGVGEGGNRARGGEKVVGLTEKYFWRAFAPALGSRPAESPIQPLGSARACYCNLGTVQRKSQPLDALLRKVVDQWPPR